MLSAVVCSHATLPQEAVGGRIGNNASEVVPLKYHPPQVCDPSILFGHVSEAMQILYGEKKLSTISKGCGCYSKAL
jgi:hypothetical protein